MIAIGAREGSRRDAVVQEVVEKSRETGPLHIRIEVSDYTIARVCERENVLNCSAEQWEVQAKTRRKTAKRGQET